jgi:hypothetical protein
MQTEWTNSSEKMTYPLVQKCISMSVAGYFEDFRLEKGGATFWVHVMDGELVSSGYIFALNRAGIPIVFLDFV